MFLEWMLQQSPPSRSENSICKFERQNHHKACSSPRAFFSRTEIPPRILRSLKSLDMVVENVKSLVFVRKTGSCRILSAYLDIRTGLNALLPYQYGYTASVAALRNCHVNDTPAKILM